MRTSTLTIIILAATVVLAFVEYFTFGLPIWSDIEWIVYVGAGIVLGSSLLHYLLWRRPKKVLKSILGGALLTAFSVYATHFLCFIGYIDDTSIQDLLLMILILLSVLMLPGIQILSISLFYAFYCKLTRCY